MKRVYALTKTELARHKLPVGGVILATIGVAVFDLLTPWPMKFLIDNLLLGKPLEPQYQLLAPVFESTVTALAVICGAVVVIALLKTISEHVQLMCSTRIGYSVVHGLRTDIFNRVQRYSLAFHRRNRSGELMSRIASDTLQLRELFGDWLISAAMEALMILGLAVVMLAINWRLALLALSVAPALFVVLAVVNRRVRSSASQQRKADGFIASVIAETLYSIQLIQTFGREEFETERFEHYSQHNLNSGMKTARLSAVVNRAVSLVSAIGLCATMVYGAVLVLRGTITPGDLLVFTAYVNKLYKPVRNLSKLTPKITRAVVSAQRIFEIVDAEGKFDTRSAPGSQARVMPLKGEIELKDVSFDFDDGRMGVANVSLHVRAGEKVAIVGDSGSGKSTLVNLILGLYTPNQGRVLVDGKSLSSAQMRLARQQMGVVLQEALLLDQSVADNISFGKPEASRADVERAAARAGADEFVRALPDGYDTVLDERAATLSGGQRQRLSLARALIKEPAVLLLDEATSAVDPATASEIWRSVFEASEGRTLIAVTHQLTEIHRYDRVLRMHRGRLYESDTAIAGVGG